MTTAGIARDLAGFLVPIGWIGAALAVIAAIVAGVAIARGAGGLSGGAVGVWIPFAVLSSTASFATQWTPVIIAGAALAATLVLGGVVRAIIRVADSDRLTRRRVAATAADVADVPAPSTTTVIVPARPSNATGAVAVVR